MQLRSKSSLVSAFAIVIAISGCDQATPPQPPLLQSTAALTIPVQKQTESHPVHLAASGKATVLERERLRAFIGDLAGNRPEALHVAISGEPTTAQVRELTSLLIADGVDPQKIVLATPAGAIRGSITIMVDRYVATPPLCNPWGSAYTASAEVNANPARADIGCSNLSNLGAMVADPHDLVKGSSDPYADGATAATAVSRYHSDDVKPLLRPGGFAPGGTGSSGGGGAGGSASSGGM